ncbi:MAG: GNAT family N-acetyltransferase, partial [Candidatus Bathyarchaeia archaeon]
MSAKIRGMRREDIPETAQIFSDIVDELHEERDEGYRQFYKERYSEEVLENRIDREEGLHLVAEEEERIVGFLFGWHAEGVGDIHWLGVSQSNRRRGCASGLVEEALRRFEREGCYRVESYCYSRLEHILRFFEKFGFEQRALLEKDFFGSRIVLMAKELRPVSAEETTRRIILVGEAGQGVRLMAKVLADILAALGKGVCLNVIYGASVRGDEPVTAELVYSDGKIDTPFIERADLLLQLSRTKDPTFEAEKVIIEEMACLDDYTPLTSREGERIPFRNISTERFGSPLFVNMIALGRLLNYIGVNIEMVNFEAELPPRFLRENIEAIKYGYV